MSISSANYKYLLETDVRDDKSISSLDTEDEADEIKKAEYMKRLLEAERKDELRIDPSDKYYDNCYIHRNENKMIKDETTNHRFVNRLVKRTLIAE